MRWAGHVARMGERKGAYRVLVGRPDENILLNAQNCKVVQVHIRGPQCRHRCFLDAGDRQIDITVVGLFNDTVTTKCVYNIELQDYNFMCQADCTVDTAVSEKHFISSFSTKN
jgi:hypothetical protein